MINPSKHFSQFSFTVQNNIANTDVQLNQKLYQWFWRQQLNKTERNTSYFSLSHFCSSQVIRLHFDVAANAGTYLKQPSNQRIF
jgi:hypothetical protein